MNYTIEGGDIHPLRRDLVVIGFSERSSPAAIDQLASTLFDETEVRDVIVVVMPKEHNAIHLDMIFTQVDRELCVVFPPHFVGPERLPVLHWRKGRDDASTSSRTCSPRLPRAACRWSRSSAAATGARFRSASSGRPDATSSRCGPASFCRISATRRRFTSCSRMGFRVDSRDVLSHRRRTDRRGRARRDHVRRERAGARRRRAALHDVSGPARRSLELSAADDARHRGHRRSRSARRATWPPGRRIRKRSSRTSASFPARRR